MKFRNINKEFRGLFDGYFNGYSSISVKNRRTKEAQSAFAGKWSGGMAVINDWLYANPEEVKLVESGLNENEMTIVNHRRSKLYDLYLEKKVQDVFSARLKEVILYVPDSIKLFCTEELQWLQTALDEAQTKKQNTYYFREWYLDTIPNFKSVFTEVTSAGYKSMEDIHSDKGILEAEALARYRTYLEKFLEEGIDEEESTIPDCSEISLKWFWPDLFRFANTLTVQYRSSTHHYKEESYVDYTVLGLSGCSEWSLRKQMDRMFDNGYSNLLERLKAVPIDEQKDFVVELIDQIRELSYIVSDGEYIEEENEYRPRTEYKFKKFTSLRYQGNSDLRFAHYSSSRAFMDRKLVVYTEAWIDSIQAMERKLEHLLNNLELVNRLSVTFDVKSIFENVFIIESESIARQGTAFYLKDIGIITCDHCLRDDAGNLCKDALIYKHDKIGDRVPIKIIKTDKNYDLAVLELAVELPGFLGTGLEKGSADKLERTDVIGVAGFPNYNFGDSGNFTSGSVSMFRTISSIRHILVTNPLVEGNSGGPGIDRLGQVVGIVTTGTSTFAKTSTTEKHGLTPIELVDLLLRI